MTEDDYYATVRVLGLKPTKVPTVYFDRDNMSRNVPLAKNLTPEQRAETIQKIKELMGIFPRD